MYYNLFIIFVVSKLLVKYLVKIVMKLAQRLRIFNLYL